MNLARAKSANRRLAVSLGWGGRIPQEAVAYLQGLGSPVDSDKFARAVKEFQKAYVIPPYDGILGIKSWNVLRRRFDEDSWILRCCWFGEVPLTLKPNNPNQTIYSYRDHLDLHRYGGFRNGNNPKQIILHWGGVGTTSCFTALANRGLSSHFGVDRRDVNNWLNLSKVAYHAGGWANQDTIGIDICQSPEAKNAGKNGAPATVITNPTHRGPRECLPLNQDTCETVAWLCVQLCGHFKIPVSWPADHVVLDKTKAREYGILGHHHVSPRKWDVAPWFRQITDAVNRELGV